MLTSDFSGHEDTVFCDDAFLYKKALKIYLRALELLYVQSKVNDYYFYKCPN